MAPRAYVLTGYDFNSFRFNCVSLLLDFCFWLVYVNLHFDFCFCLRNDRRIWFALSIWKKFWGAWTIVCSLRRWGYYEECEDDMRMLWGMWGCYEEYEDVVRNVRMIWGCCEDAMRNMRNMRTLWGREEDSCEEGEECYSINANLTVRKVRMNFIMRMMWGRFAFEEGEEGAHASVIQVCNTCCVNCPLLCWYFLNTLCAICVTRFFCTKFSGNDIATWLFFSAGAFLRCMLPPTVSIRRPTTFVFAA